MSEQELLREEEIVIAICAKCPFDGRFTDEDCHACQRNMKAVSEAQVAKVKKLYPIMYQEEADFVGWLLDRGWIPPGEVERKKLDRPELRDDQISMAFRGHGLHASMAVKRGIAKDIVALIEPLIEEGSNKAYKMGVEDCELRDKQLIEEAKKQGEERIIKWVEDTDILTMLSPRQRRNWQALKEEKSNE